MDAKKSCSCSCSLFSGFTDKKSTLSEAAPMEEESRVISSDAIASPNATDVASSSFSQPNADTDVSDPTGNIQKATDIGEVNVDIDELIEYTSELLEFIEKGEASRKLKTARAYWPRDSGGLSKLKDLLSERIHVTNVKDVVPSDSKAIARNLLRDIGSAHWITASFLVVAEILERFEAISSNKTEFLSLLKGMITLAKELNQLKERPMLTNVMEDFIKGTELIVEASIACCRQMDSSKFSRFFSASVDKRELLKFNEKIDIMYRHFQNQMAICNYDAIIRKPLQRERRYPEYAVGIEGPTQEVIELLEWESDKNAVAVVLLGLGGIGKTTLADAVFALTTVVGCRYSKVSLFDDITSTSPDVIQLQNRILEDLISGETKIPEIERVEDGKLHIGCMLEKEVAFIYIDNVRHGGWLQQLLPGMEKSKKVRLLITGREDVIEECTGCGIETKAYAMNIKKMGKDRFISSYERLDQTLRGSFHDICSFFNGWDWNEVANIVGASELNRLEEEALVIKDTNMTARVHDVILSIGAEERSGRVFTSASEIVNLDVMKDEDIRRITGIWLLNENKDPVSIPASKLDLMCCSLRVFALGNLGKVEGECKNVFEKLVFLQAGIPHLPFDVVKIKKLRYFSSEPKNLRPHEGSSTHREQKYGPEFPLTLSLEMHASCNFLNQCYEDCSWKRKCRCLVGHRQERSLLDFVDIFRVLDPEDIYDRVGFFIALKDALHGLKNFTSIEDLPHGLGNLIYLSREIDLLQSSSYLKSIARLMSLVCSIDISFCSGTSDWSANFPIVNFVLSRCRSLEKLRLGRFGELKSLTVLNLQDCWLLKKLPGGFGKLKDLVELDLSFCLLLEELPANFHNLSSLQTLKLSFCERLKKLPLKFHDLASLQLLSLRSCKTLEGESMDNVLETRTLKELFIEESPMLKQRWEEIQRLGHPSSCHVYT